MSSKISAKDFVLLLLNSNGNQEINGKLYFQKEMFLVVKEIYPDLDVELKFEPYQYGSYSKKQLALLDNLESESLINIQNHNNTCTYSITEKGIGEIEISQFNDEIIEKMQNLKINSNNLGYKGLLHYVYFNYPKYTEKSKIKNKILGDN